MKSILFDLDGTLWNSCETVCQAWNSCLASHGIDSALTVQDFHKVMGMLIEDIAKTLIPSVPIEKAVQLARECARYENAFLSENGGILYPDIENIIPKLAENYTLCIVSNCEDGYIEAFFKAHGLGKYFKDFEHPGRTGMPKGENIKLIINRNQLDSPVYVGDTQHDANAAREAGIPFIHAAYGFGKVSDFYKQIRAPKELLNIF